METSPSAIVWIVIMAIMFITFWVRHSQQNRPVVKNTPPVEEYGTKQVVDGLVLFDMVDD